MLEKFLNQLGPNMMADDVIFSAILAFVVIFVIIFVVVAVAVSKTKKKPNKKSDKMPSNALEILKERYAKGEITKEEFDKIRDDLE